MLTLINAIQFNDWENLPLYLFKEYVHISTYCTEYLNHHKKLKLTSLVLLALELQRILYRFQRCNTDLDLTQNELNENIYSHELKDIQNKLAAPFMVKQEKQLERNYHYQGCEDAIIVALKYCFIHSTRWQMIEKLLSVNLQQNTSVCKLLVHLCTQTSLSVICYRSLFEYVNTAADDPNIGEGQFLEDVFNIVISLFHFVKRDDDNNPEITGLLDGWFWVFCKITRGKHDLLMDQITSLATADFMTWLVSSLSGNKYWRSNCILDLPMLFSLQNLSEQNVYTKVFLSTLMLQNGYTTSPDFASSVCQLKVTEDRQDLVKAAIIYCFDSEYMNCRLAHDLVSLLF